jgi:hypothetical protein
VFSKANADREKEISLTKKICSAKDAGIGEEPSDGGRVSSMSYWGPVMRKSSRSSCYEGHNRPETQYRGYKITMRKQDLCWMVRVSPMRSDLPILRRSDFHTITQSERRAMAQAKRRIDELLQA